MLRARTHTTSLLIAVAALFGMLASGCGDDDDAADTVVVEIAAAAGTTGSDERGTDGPGDEEPDDTRDYPSLDEVGRAEFTHTIVAGDFLRKIADTYEIEIDDIVGANEWEDGRDHLLLPGDVIYLPADAVPPPETTAAVGDDGGQGAAPPEGSIDACTDGALFDSAVVRDGDTIESFAAAVGVTVDDLNANNGFHVTWPDGRPYFGVFEPGFDAGFPCRQNWPAHVEFFVSPEGNVCSYDTTTAGRYTVQPGDTPESVAASIGISVAVLDENNDGYPGYDAFAAGTQISVCTSWFE